MLPAPALVTPALVTPALWAHGTHASRTLLEYVSSTGDLQITMTIPAAELEEYLRFVTKRQFELDRDKDAARIVFEQLRQWFQLQDAKGRPLALRWVGMNVTAQQVECFLEAKAPQLDGARVRNVALVGWAGNWVNQVIARRDQTGASWSYQFHQGKTDFAVIRLPANAPVK